MSNFQKLIVSTIAALVFSPAAMAKDNSAPSSEPIKVRWLLAHEPARVFERAAKQFKSEVEKNSNGRMAVEILTTKEYVSKYGAAPKYQNGELLDDVALVKAGEIEMTQTYTTSLGKLNPKMWVLDLPFLFRDHAHAKKIIDGAIGEKIMAGLVKSNVRGLAFTYSGGYRVITSRDQGITKVADFKNLTIRTANSPVARAMFEELGAKAVPMDHDSGIQQVKEGSIMAAETTIARFDDLQQKATPILNDTQHSLFLTSMVVNEKFYSKLPADLQDVVRKAARNAAESERQDSLTDESQLRKTFAGNGMHIVSMPAGEVQKLRELTKPLYKRFTPMFGADLISSIQTAQ